MTATLDLPRGHDAIDNLRDRLERREAEDRALHTGERFDIRELGVETMRRGLMGYMVLLTGNHKAGLPYVGAFIDYRGKTIETTFSEYATPEAALSALLSQSRAK